MMMMSKELLFLPLRIEKQLLILRIQKANLELKKQLNLPFTTGLCPSPTFIFLTTIKPIMHEE